MNLQRHIQRLKLTAGTWAFISTMALAACGDVPAGDIDKKSSSIVNGIDVSPQDASYWGMVAIYHRLANASGSAGPWFGRPCSGMIFAHQGNESIIITARHCVTVDGEVDGVLAPTGWISVASGNAPGRPNPNPPSAAKHPIFIDGMPITQADTLDRDAAILYVYAPTWAGMANRKAVLMVPPAAGLPFTAYGYGLNDRDNACYNNTNYNLSSGVLRRGEFVSKGGISDGQGGFFTFDYTSSGPSIICGDSGGPDLGNVWFNMNWTAFYGLHDGDSTEVRITTSAVPGPWMSQEIGGLYLSPLSSTGQNLNRRADNVMYLDSTAVGTPLIYDADAQTITQQTASGFDCLDWDDSIGAFVLTGCNESRPFQRWEVTTTGYIRNPTSGQCIRHMADGSVRTSLCPAASASQAERSRFTWAWHAQK
jgi:hypothetical protein